MIEPRHPIGPETVIRRFSADLDIPIAKTPDVPMRHSGVTEIRDGWRLTTNVKRVFRLFEIPIPGLERRVLTYRAELRLRSAKEPAYLELWWHVPGGGLHFSKGLHQIVAGKRWRTCEIPLYVEAGQRLDWIGLNVTLDGPGMVEVRNVELAWRAVPGLSNPRQAVLTATRLTWMLAKLVVLGPINVVLIVGQLSLIILSEVFGFGILALDTLFTWWPKRKGPTVGKMAG